MKKFYVLLLCTFAFAGVNAQNRVASKKEMDMSGHKAAVSTNKTQAIDTLWEYVNRASGAIYYGAGKGYVFGVNYADIQGNITKLTDETALHYDPYGTTVKVTEILAWVASIDVIGATDTVYGRVYEAGPDSLPTTQLGYGKIAVSQMDSSFQFVLTSIAVTNGASLCANDFLVSYDYTNVTNDTFGIVSSNADSNDGMNEKRVKQKLSSALGGTWGSANGDVWVDLDCDAFIIPVIDDNPAAGLSSPNFQGLTVLPNYPNPTSGVANIHFTTDKSQEVFVKVFDLRGRTLFETRDVFTTGDHVLPVDLSKEAMGNYYYTITVNGQSFTSRINVAK